MTIVLFWDIDGTLITTDRAGIFAWQDALKALTGTEADLFAMNTAGLPDPAIARNVLEGHGYPVTPESRGRLLQLYEEALPRSLPRKAGRVLPNVREILEALDGRVEVRSLLLTGNTRAGAEAKLKHYRLDHFFTGGAFADEADDRSLIAQQALAEARRLVGEVHADKVYVIGDTPHDIVCGGAIDARVVAVATGAYSLEQLQPLSPWWAVQQLPEVGQFAQRLGIDILAERQ